MKTKDDFFGVSKRDKRYFTGENVSHFHFHTSEPIKIAFTCTSWLDYDHDWKLFHILRTGHKDKDKDA